MKRFLKTVAAIILFLVVAGAAVWFLWLKPKPLPVTEEERQTLAVMPLPADVKMKKGMFRLEDEFGISVNGPDDSVTRKAVERFSNRLSALTGKNSGGEKMIMEVKWVSPVHPVQPLRTDESYGIDISQDRISLSATSGYGIIRGLETLLQLLSNDGNGWYWRAMIISDRPRFPWRGLMIDAGRHFIPAAVIKRNLDAMAAAKMNVFHWHLSEYQGFRVESMLFPLLHEKGSEGEYYTQDEIREIVSYAAERGIRVVPEFDLPGHSSGFLVGYPWLGSAPGPYSLESRFGIFEPVIDPTREEIYDFFDRFFGEMATLFPDSCFHIGGDEVNYAHWDSNPEIQLFMKKNNIADNHVLQAYFNSRLEKILVKYGKRMVGWDEILNPGLGNEIIIQSWRSQKSLFSAVQSGKSGVMSWGYYLDHKLPAGKHYSTDPLVIAGAVTIKPDSLNWKQYEIDLSVSGNSVRSGFVIYGETDSLRGFFSMMDNQAVFEAIKLEGDHLTLVFHTDYGDIKCDSRIAADSVSGKLTLGIISFPFTGKQVGGSNMPGTVAPRVEQVKPLSEEEKLRVLGGEACMWTEVASAQNIESRIWPRLAAMAEKWWTPAELTKDERDMYRRLESFSGYIGKLGSRHLLSQKEMINDLAGDGNPETVATLIEALHEVSLVDRMTFDASVKTPLNGVADAALPESMTAVRFRFAVEDYLSASAGQRNGEEVRKMLGKWEANHKDFVLLAEGDERLEKVTATSADLSALAGIALKAMDAIEGKLSVTAEEKSKMLSEINSMAVNRADVYIAVRPSAVKMVEAVPVK